MPDYGGGGYHGMGGDSSGLGRPGGGNKPDSSNRPSVQNLQFNPNIFGPPQQTPPQISLGIPNLGIQISNPTIGQGITNLGTVTTGAGFNFGGDGAGQQGGLNQDFTPQVGPPPVLNIPTIAMSTAPVAAAPEPVPEETNPLINFINKRLVNPYVDAVYNYGLPLSQFTPTQFGLISLYGNMFNFNPTKDEETGEISTSNLGEVGTATFGKLNLDNYIGAEEVNPQDFYGAAFDFDDEGNFEGTNFEKLEKFTEEQGLSLKPGMDLEQNLIDNREFGGDGPQKQFVPPSTSLAEEGAASATDPQQPGQTTPTDAVNLDAVYSGLSDAEKATVDKIVEMDDYDLPYALTYVLYGGPLF